MEDQDTSGSLEMRIMELENQLKELREAQQAMSGQMGAQAAVACSYCYCSYCYCSYCYVAGCQQQTTEGQAQPSTIPCAPGMMGASPCIPCVAGPAAGLSPILFCRICYPCIVECICGPCMCSACGFSGGGFSGGGGRFGGLGG